MLRFSGESQGLEATIGSRGLEGTLQFSVLSSGSSGNATYLEVGGWGLLIDAGLSCRRLRGLLTRIGRDLPDIHAVLLTHDHADHTSGLRSLLRERNVPLYAAPGVAEVVKDATLARPGEPLNLEGGISAAFFEVPHDSPTYGLHLSDGERNIALATDLGEVNSESLDLLRGVDALILEANHDTDWLWRGPYSADLKRRVASSRGHLSNHQATEAALALAPHGLKDLVLAHLSEKNNSPARATGTVRKALKAAGYGGIRVRAALARHPTPWVEVGQPIEEREYGYKYGGQTGAASRLFEVE